MNDVTPSHPSQPKPERRANAAGGLGYSQDPRGALAMLALTWSGRDSFYRPAESIAGRMVDLARQVPPVWLGKLARYCRRHAGLRESPALLCAVLARADGDVFRDVAPRVLDDPALLRRFVYYLRNGVTGRASLGSRAKRFIKHALEVTPAEELVRHSAGQNPALADLICLSHPKPADRRQEALFAWLIGRPCNLELLPPLVRELEDFRADPSRPAPRVPIELLTSGNLCEADWRKIAEQADWHETRRYLNTFCRNRVFESADMTGRIAEKLSDPEEIRWAAPSPQQVFSAITWADPLMPEPILQALRGVLEQTLELVPANPGRVCVAIDVSGSMHCPVTGFHGSAGSLFRTVDLASLIGAGLLRHNHEGLLLIFDEIARPIEFPRDKDLMTQVTHLTELGTGGTACSAPLRRLLDTGETADLIVIISDNQTWAEPQRPARSEMLALWQKYQEQNPHTRLVCLDLQPEEALPMPDLPGVLHLAGFTTETFHLIDAFSRGTLNARDLPGLIENMISD